MSDDIVIITTHEKGFPNADMYRDGQHFTDFDWNGSTPDDFMTGKIGESLADFEAQAKEHWPGAEIESEANVDFFEFGRDAYADGLELGDCPFVRESDKRNWTAGWHDAQQDESD